MPNSQRRFGHKIGLYYRIDDILRATKVVVISGNHAVKKINNSHMQDRNEVREPSLVWPGKIDLTR